VAGAGRGLAAAGGSRDHARGKRFRAQRELASQLAQRHRVPRASGIALRAAALDFLKLALVAAAMLLVAVPAFSAERIVASRVWPAQEYTRVTLESARPVKHMFFTVTNPDRLVIDLDPGEPAGLPECAQVALLVRAKLDERGLASRAVTSGSKGLHLYAALPGRLDSDGTTALAKEVAEELQAEHPKAVTATMTKARRSGKVFLDWSQNARSKTTISPYSLRGRELPTVAAPLTWAEVEAGADDPLALEQLRFEEVLERVDEHGDLFTATT
jgi:hypothetical protein